MSPAGVGRPALFAASAAAGAVAGLAGPFVVLTGQVPAGELGLVEHDSTLTDDGFGVPIGFGIVGLLFIVTAVAAAVVAWLFVGR